MTYPVTIVDNFFEDPDAVVKMAEEMKYYNPNTGNWPGMFTLQIVSLEYGNVEFAVVDIQGKTILKDYATITKGLNKIEIKNNLKSGLYFIEFANDYFKFVVQ